MSDEYEHEDGPEASAEHDTPKNFDVNDPYWDSDAALEAVKMEKSMNPHESDADLTQRIFREAAPQAANGLVHLAFHATNENTRFNAQKYVVERLLGKLGDGDAQIDSPLDKLVKELAATAEQYANGER